MVGKLKDDEKFDYVYLDGSHDLTIDGFAYLLIDKLLKVGGHIEFDDYAWTFGKRLIPQNQLDQYLNMYTRKQVNTPHVKIIVDKLVKCNPNYVEVTPNRIYKKIA